MSISRVAPVFAAYRQPAGIQFGGVARPDDTPDDTKTEKVPSSGRRKASGWDWFVRAGVALTMVFSAVTATAAVVIQQQVASIEERVPSQQEIDELETKINDRLDALPDGERIREYVDEIEETRQDLEKLRQLAEDAGLTSEDSQETAERISRLTERLRVLEGILGLSGR